MSKLLKDILKNINYSLYYKGEESIEIPEITIDEIIIDSRKAKLNTLFVALVGTQKDGHDFIPQVLEMGCSVYICEKKIENNSAYQILVKDSNKVLGELSANFYDHPSKKLKLIGITGTNGKTTTATLAYQCFNDLGYKSGLLSTIVNKIGEKEIVSTHTTPNPIEINRLLSLMLKEGCTHCFMEVSSHAIVQRRIDGLHFDVAVFANITHDHLDYHKTFDEYIKAKKTFFDTLDSKAIALTNLDDKNGLVMLQNTKAKKMTYALKSPADYKVKIIENNLNGLELQINNRFVCTLLTGVFNAYNITAVYAIGDILGLDQIELLTTISKQKAIKGRFQSFQSESGITAIVDYAHTPDALENVLKTIQQVKQNALKKSKIISVVGCGGDRDKEKRPKMAKIACLYSNQVILTSDNPRSEDPSIIIKEMSAGISEQDYSKVLEIIDREQAIKTACSIANKEDIILIAGKGHETYQEINGVKNDFDDYKIVTENLEKIKK